ncbi:arsenical pump membrane protein [Pseudonocardia thermophila]|jgi:Na+/H+ antiporter NhaD and related arsenite permeases|uniref:Arsenical pump membrane protein n=1 Tax=Pseudonocardia thermophila TaxID=1848 RepID=A0A1M6XHT7_PSETH|nr:SLC13 family permease [Pseudonocardia thermophila]SHL05468.1 arsenical pump membrane protein [Pseudonocardia thermophila]
MLVAALALLAAVLAAAVVRPHGLPEAVIAVPAALLAVGAGLVGPDRAGSEIAELAPTVGFLAAILLLGQLAAAEGVFTWLGARLAGATHRPTGLLGLVTAAAAGTTAVLSLDATVVLLTPVVLATAARLQLPARPHVYACGHLSNSASTLLPVSNLTNLLAFAACGLSFAGFTAVMTAPWLAAIAVEYAVLRLWFREDLGHRPAPVPEDVPPAPRFALAVLTATLAGFGLSSYAGIEPAWMAAAGAAVLAVRALARREITPAGIVRAADPLFCLFVLALGVVVAAVGEQGLTGALQALLPETATLTGLLAVAGIAAVLANVVNNLPATLVLLTALGPAPQPGLVLAVLLGVNIGPNLTYVGSLATLLWRSVLGRHGVRVDLREFSTLGLATVPAALVASTMALWASLAVAG